MTTSSRTTIARSSSSDRLFALRALLGEFEPLVVFSTTRRGLAAHIGAGPSGHHQEVIVTLDAGGSAIGAGWFPDPAGSPWLRWWDGAAWTEHFLDPATGAAPQVATPVAPQVATPVVPQATTPETPQSAAPATQQQASPDVPLTRRELREQQGDAHADTTPIPVAVNFDPAPPFDFGTPAVDAPVFSTPVLDAPVVSTPVVDALVVSTPVVSTPVFSAPVVDQHPPAVTPQPAATPSPFEQLLQPASVDVPQQPVAPFAPTFDASGFGQNWVTAPAPKMEDAYFPPRGEQPYVPMVNPKTTYPQAAQEVEPGTVSTAAIWIYAVIPVLHVALAWFVIEKLKLTELGTIRWAIIAGPIVIYLILAAVDRRVLLSRGHVYLASALLAILPPLYLGIRAARMGARAIAPAIVWLLLQAAGIAVLVFLFPAVISQLTAADVSTTPTIQPAPTAAVHVLTPAERAALLTPAGMAAELKSEFATKGVQLTSVTCPQLASTTDGTQVTCLGVLPISKLDIIVSVDNVNTLAAWDIVSSVPHQGN